MARVLGFGGLANTNGARDFSGKAESAAVDDDDRLIQRNHEFCLLSRTTTVLCRPAPRRIYNRMREWLAALSPKVIYA